MKKPPGKFGLFRLFRKMTEGRIQKWSEELIQILKRTVEKEAVYIGEYVDQLRRLNPRISNEQLARKIISRKSLKAGGIGAAFNVGGLITMPITMPVDLYYCFRIQARMVLSVAYVYGWDIRSESTATDILLVMAGNAGINALRKAGIKIGEEFAKKAVQKFVTREVMKRINKILSRKIITKAGAKSFTSFAKLVPIVGAPIGGGFNYVGTLTIGKLALKFYKGRDGGPSCAVAVS